MDTRQKIQTFEELRPVLARGAWTILAGEFDPLTPALAARVQSRVLPGCRLLAVIQPGSDALLDAPSRAVLIAALRAVDAVMIETSDEWRAFAATNPDLRIIDDRKACMRDRLEFERLVIGRYVTSEDS
ncbi:MAG: hypothetical protein WB676_09350 [Bryobacteraceae bacterium]